MHVTVCHSTFQSMHHRVAVLMDRISLAAIGDACKKMARHFFIRIGCLPAAPRRWLYFAAQNKPDAATVSKRSSVFSKSRYWKRDKGPIVFIGNWNRTHTQTHSDQGDSLRAVYVEHPHLVGSRTPEQRSAPFICLYYTPSSTHIAFLFDDKSHRRINNSRFINPAGRMKGVVGAYRCAA